MGLLIRALMPSTRAPPSRPGHLLNVLPPKTISLRVRISTPVKCLPAMGETQVQSLGREDPLKEMGTHSSTLAWKIPWVEEPGR